ncbi:acetamidase/formamidase family protein [Desulfobulbus rhabdoformis]|uniref:acetamidase/formamidase family protein n=1 Tax=Desulfobulbus rhabdoformis TaxID=34032 RepID=UPI00196513A5|nr:acetamidase/formamidase family protein [Desulfobulbus rhabdoformis]MBM9616580.1 acetamidase/formamidase family protein [Desulfobulbus rhabdoformis]
MKSASEDQAKDQVNLDRRKFIQYTGAVGAALAMGQYPMSEAKAVETKRMDMGGKVHILGCNEMTSTHGYWDNSTKPVLTMNSGEVVHIETGTHLMGKMIPGADINDWTTWYKEVMKDTSEACFYPDENTGAEKKKKGAGHHHLTGPIYVEDAEPGDMLQVEILNIDPGQYGFNLNPNTDFLKLGLLADDYPEGKVRWYSVNREKMNFEFLPGIEIPVKPFPGTIGVELGEKGMWSNVPPGKHGGNMDNKELVSGTALYLPVNVKGAGLKTGDSHFAQGNGEVNLNALEGAFKSITLRITVRKDLGKLIDFPMASSPTHWIMMGFHTDLYKSCQMATKQSINFLHKYYGLPELEAYAFCSQAVDLQVTQLVDYTLGIHAMIPKSCFVGEQYKERNQLLIQDQA